MFNTLKLRISKDLMTTWKYVAKTIDIFPQKRKKYTCILMCV